MGNPLAGKGLRNEKKKNIYITVGNLAVAVDLHFLSHVEILFLLHFEFFADAFTSSCSSSMYKESCLPGTSVINNILELYFASGVVLNLPWYLRVTVGTASSTKKVDLGRGSLRHSYFSSTQK